MGLLVGQAARQEGTDAVDDVLDRDEGDDQTDEAGEDGHAEDPQEPLERVRPMEKEIGGNKHHHGAGDEDSQFQEPSGTAGEDDARGDGAGPGQEGDGKGGNGDVLLFLGQPRLPAGDLGPGGAAVKEFQGYGKEENTAADLHRHDLDTEVPEKVASCGEEEDDDEAGATTPTSRQ